LSVKNRVKEATGIEVEPIYYSAGTSVQNKKIMIAEAAKVIPLYLIV
jgi:hypothetical protein